MTATVSSTPSISPQTARQAVQWWVDLHAGDKDHDAEATRDGLQRWRAAHPEHEAAWQRIETLGSEMAGIPLPLARAAWGAPASTRRRRTVQVLTLLLVSGAGAAAGLRTQAWSSWTADAVAAVGERRMLALPDGGTVVLNTGSAINIRYTADERVVQLVRGEILVQTAADAMRRSFIVQTGAGRVRALGTRFTVREREAVFDVGVLEGAVELRPLDAPGRVRRLNAGEQGWLSRTEGEPSGHLPADASAWVDGMLVVSGMRLDDFLTELSRYRHGRLGCDPVVAHLLVSGTYPLVDTDRILAALAAALPIQIHTWSRYWVTVHPLPDPRSGRS